MRFVVFDLEANADHPRPESQEIIEIGALLVEDGRVSKEMSSLVAPTPGRPLASLTVELTGITEETLKGAPSRVSALEGFLEFCGDLPLVAHNGSTYDYPLLLSALDRVGLPEPGGERLDTLELAHVVFPRAGKESVPDIRGGLPPRSRRLMDLAEHFGAAEGAGPAHRALSDAGRVWGVMSGLLGELNRDDPVRRVQRWILEITGHPWAVFCQPHIAELAAAYRPDLVEIIPLPPPSEQEQDTHDQPAFDEPIDEEEVERDIDLLDLVAPLTEEGELMTEGMEHRPSQEEMALQVATGLARSENLMVEAPTGTGKTLAYLVPATRLAASWNTQILVSTYTKALQDQVCLTLRDISHRLSPVRWTVLKGLGNYLSVQALAEELVWLDPFESGRIRDNPLFSDQTSDHLADHHLGLALAVVLGWAAETPTGEWDDLRDGWLRRRDATMYRLRSRLSMTETPGRARNAMEKRCFFVRALKRLSAAEIVVANHSLMLLRDQMTGHSPRLIVDEAHELESAARSAFTGTVSRRGLWRLLYMVYHDRSSGSLLHRYLGSLPSGSARDRGQVGAERVVRYRRACEPRIQDLGETLLEYLEATRGWSPGAEESLSTRVTRVDLNRFRWQEVTGALELLADSFSLLADALDALPVPERLRAGRSPDELKRRIINASDAAKTIAELCFRMADIDSEDLLEVALVCDLAWRQEEWRWEMSLVPLAVNDRLAEVWEEKKSVIMTSATLTVAGSFDYVAAGLGIGESRRELLESPFPDLPRQMLVVITGYLPNPSGPSLEEFAEVAPEEMARLFEISRGRALALFTANRRMERAAGYLKDRLFPRFTVLCQGEASAPELTEGLRTPSQPTCLLGSGTFWQGIDIPGEALSLLVMEKLPFSSPDDPVVAARLEVIGRRGGSPFEDFLLPEAVLGFRQGAGRLIRTPDDRGVLVVLDKRLGFARYAPRFLDSLTGSPPVLKAERPAQCYRAIARHLGAEPGRLGWAGDAASR
ncbi:MAG: DEAD/DEAH box helicase [Acidimicrobiia bacterium]|nr:DEAD/DEAH box helicase [Acidimicrobiia bacterium]